MAQVFTSRPGQVVFVDDPLDAPMALRLDVWPGPVAMKAIITEIAVVQACNVQFLHSYGDLIYAYVFGDRIAPLQVAGLAFSEACGIGGRSGFESVLEFYAANRAAARAAPAQFQIGASAGGYFQGLLTEMTGGLGNPETRLSPFRLGYKVLPRIRG